MVTLRDDVNKIRNQLSDTVNQQPDTPEMTSIRFWALAISINRPFDLYHLGLSGTKKKIIGIVGTINREVNAADGRQNGTK
jgi:hypothetical protein